MHQNPEGLVKTQMWGPTLRVSDLGVTLLAPPTSPHAYLFCLAVTSMRASVGSNLLATLSQTWQIKGLKTNIGERKKKQVGSLQLQGLIRTNMHQLKGLPISSFLNSLDWHYLLLRDPLLWCCQGRSPSSKSPFSCLSSRFSLFTFASVSLKELLGLINGLHPRKYIHSPIWQNIFYLCILGV